MRRVTTSDTRLIVVRAWQDLDRLVIRVLVSVEPGAPAVESVFGDVESATGRLNEVLTELRDHADGVDRPAAAETER